MYIIGSLYAISLYTTMKYCSLAKERPWVEHFPVCAKEVGWVLFWVFSHLTTKERLWVERLTGLPKRGGGGGALLGVFAFNHERVPMSVVLP